MIIKNYLYLHKDYLIVSYFYHFIFDHFKNNAIFLKLNKKDKSVK